VFNQGYRKKSYYKMFRGYMIETLVVKVSYALMAYMDFFV